MKRVLLSLGALGLAISPVAVSALETSKASSRAVAPVEGESNATGESTLLVVLAGVAATVGAIVIVADGDDNDDGGSISG